MLFVGDFAFGAEAELEETELSQRFHERCGGATAPSHAPALSLVRDEKR